MGCTIRAAGGLLFLLVHLFCISTTEEVQNLHHVVIKLDYSGVRGGGVAGSTVDGTWAPPPKLSAPGSGLLCTKATFPDNDAYCSFNHDHENVTWTTVFVNTTHDSVKDAECVTQFDRVNPHGDFGVVERMVTFHHNSTVCYSTKGERFRSDKLYFVRYSVENGQAEYLPSVDGLRFAVGEINHLMIQGIENIICIDRNMYQSESFGVSEGEQERVEIEDNMVYFPLYGVSGVCNVVGGRETVATNCQLDSRGRCRPEK